MSGVRSIRFYQVVPMDHLLARMETDSTHVVKRIVSLLISSFQPSKVPLSEQVSFSLSRPKLKLGHKIGHFLFNSGTVGKWDTHT